MEWISETKIPVGQTAKTVFDWLQTHGGWFFDGLSVAMETLIESLFGSCKRHLPWSSLASLSP